MSTATPQRRNGITLVELLVVIGITAVLIAILLPTLRKARMASQRIACQSNIHQLYLGVMLYCDANHDWFPTKAAARDGAAYVHYPDDWVWWEANREVDESPIARQLNIRGDKLRSLLRCPADLFDGRMTPPGQSAGQGPYLYSYAINTSTGTNSKPPPSRWRTKRSQWRRLSEKILFTEVLDDPPLSWAGPVWAWGNRLTYRHGQAVSRTTHTLMGINVSAAFMDGHVEAVDQDFADDWRQNQLTP
jgi:hypothetical protein